MNKSDRIALGITAVALGATVLCYPHLPDPMPVHFDLHGKADGYMPRWIGASFGFAFGAIPLALLRFGDRFLPERWGKRMGTPAMRVAGTIVVGLLAGVQGIILYAGVAAPPNVARLTAFVMSAFALAFGLVAPKLRRNAFAGWRTPWTMASDEVWARTHRFAGHLLVVASIVGFLGALAGSLPVAIGALVAACLAPLPYSWWVAQRARSAGEHR